jgi:hypothetical protein
MYYNLPLSLESQWRGLKPQPQTYFNFVNVIYYLLWWVKLEVQIEIIIILETKNVQSRMWMVVCNREGTETCRVLSILRRSQKLPGL